MLISVVLFFNAIVVDIVWALYIRRTSEGRHWQAGLFAAGTILFGGFTGFEIAKHLWYVLPAGLGAFAGTTLTVYRDHRKAQTS